jgi:hypothetical protein
MSKPMAKPESAPAMDSSVQTHPSGRNYKVRSEDVHDWDAIPLVEGVITHLDSQKIEDDVRRYMLVDTGEFVARVYETSALEEPFNQAVVGDHVRFEFLRMTQTKKAGRKFRRFSYRVWSE